MNTTDLRFLADESCDFAAVRSLRAHGFDVLAVGEYMQRSVDAQLLDQAAREQRILLTEGKDFGWLVFVSNADSAGVILIRFPANARQVLGPAILHLVLDHGEALRGTFTVIQPGSVRISRRPVV